MTSFRSLIIVMFILSMSTSTFAIGLSDNNTGNNNSVLGLDDLINSFLNNKESAAPVSDSDPAPGPRIVIQDVVINGNHNIPKYEILRRISTRTGDYFDRIKLDRDIRQIKTQGSFRDITWKISADNRLLINVEENPRLTTVRIATTTVFPEDNLLKLLHNQSGSILNLNDVRKDIQTIQDYYINAGFVFAKVLGVQTPELDGEPLIFNLAEGIIEKIVVIGNDKTKDWVINREMKLKAGDVFNRDQFQKDIRFIYNLGYFANINPQVLPGNDPNSIIITIEVEEKSSGSVGFGGGFNQLEGFFGFVDLNIDNIAGTGQLVTLKGQFGGSTTYQAKYFTNWFMNERRSFSLRKWYTSGSSAFLSSGTFSYQNETRNGGDLSFGIPLNENISLVTTILGEEVLVPSASTDIESNYHVNSIAEKLVYDTRDYNMNPRTGQLYSMRLEQGIALDSRSISYTRLDGSVEHYFPIGDNATLASRFLGGIKLGSVFGSEYYYVGGANTVRGYNDSSPFATGTREFIFNLEYRHTFNDFLQVVVFYDLGEASNYIFPLGDHIPRTGRGAGVRLQTPMGPIRLDYGIPDHGEPVFHFSIGQAF